MRHLQIFDPNYLPFNQTAKPSLDISKNFFVPHNTDRNLSNINAENDYFYNTHVLTVQNPLSNSSNFCNHFSYFDPNQREEEIYNSNILDNKFNQTIKNHNLNQINLNSNDIFYNDDNCVYHQKYYNNEIIDKKNILRRGNSNNVFNNSTKYKNDNYCNYANNIYLIDPYNNLNNSNNEFYINYNYSNSRFNTITENYNNILLNNNEHIDKNISNSRNYIDKFGNKRPLSLNTVAYQKIAPNKFESEKKYISHSRNKKYDQKLKQRNNTDIYYYNEKQYEKIEKGRKLNENLDAFSSPRKYLVEQKIIKTKKFNKNNDKKMEPNIILKNEVTNKMAVPKKIKFIINQNSKNEILKNDSNTEQKINIKIINEETGINQKLEKENMKNNKIKNNEKNNKKNNNVIKEIKEIKKEKQKEITKKNNNNNNDENKKNEIIHNGNNIIKEIKEIKKKNEISSNTPIKEIKNVKKNKEIMDIKKNIEIKEIKDNILIKEIKEIKNVDSALQIIPNNEESEKKNINITYENKEKNQAIKKTNNKIKITENKVINNESERNNMTNEIKKETNKNKEKKINAEMTENKEIIKNKETNENKSGEKIIENKEKKIMKTSVKTENKNSKTLKPTLQITHYNFIYDKFHNSPKNNSTSKNIFSPNKPKNLNKCQNLVIKDDIHKEEYDSCLDCDTGFQLTDKEIIFLKNSLNPDNNKYFTLIDNLSKLQSTNSVKFTLYRTKIKIPNFCSYNKINYFYSDNLKLDQFFDQSDF